MELYHRETVVLIRASGARLLALHDHQLVSLWSEYSQKVYQHVWVEASREEVYWFVTWSNQQPEINQKILSAQQALTRGTSIRRRNHPVQAWGGRTLVSHPPGIARLSEIRMQTGRMLPPFERHLLAAAGYLELGLPVEAQEQLENIEPLMHGRVAVLIVRLGIFQALRAWGSMEIVAARLCEQRPDESQWPLTLAYAVRCGRSLQDAREILLTARNRFPEDAIIHYSLACNEAQLGQLSAAREHLRQACRLRRRLRAGGAGRTRTWPRCTPS